MAPTSPDSLVARRRIQALMMVLVALGALMGARLVFLQLFQHDRYKVMAAGEHQRKYEVAARRGQIYVRDGNDMVPLALNQTFKLMYADPSLIKHQDDVAAQLSKATGEPAATYVAAMKKGGEYQVLSPKLGLDAANKVKALNLAGVGLVDQNYRTYPEGQLASQLLGFVNGQGVGQYGIEGYLDSKLSGHPGLLNAKTDTNGIPIATAANTIVPAKDGDNVVLTIDRNVQAQAEKYLEQGVKDAHAESGSVIVMDPKTGAIKAMANYPTYDPNNYGKVKDYNAFMNSTVSDEFEPGSGFKVITMSAGLDSGKVNPNTTYTDSGSVKVGDKTIGNADGHTDGPNTTMTTVIKDSLNTGVVFVLKALGGNPDKITSAGKQTLYDYMTKHFGFGVRTGIEQASEASGTVLPPNTDDVTYANNTFGQGISVTMLQMVTAVSAIANGGTLYQPYLVDQTMPADGTLAKTTQPRVVRSNVISKQAATDMTAMMQTVVDHGSGWVARTPGYKIAGKTGTAQIPNPNGPGYLDGQNIGSFVGFAPVEDPQFVMMVRINKPQVSGFAESTTVPVFANIAHWMLRYYGIPPSS